MGALKVTIQLKAKDGAPAPNGNYSAAPQMREIGLRAIAALCEQAYDSVQYPLEGCKADAVLLDSYR